MRKTTVRAALAVAVVSICFLPACSSDRDPVEAIPPDPLVGFRQLEGAVELPSQSPLSGDDLTILTGFHQTSSSTDGSFEADVPTTGQPTLIIGTYGDEPALLSFIDPNQEVAELSAASTAEALIALNPFFLGSSLSQRRNLVQAATSHASFAELVDQIEQLLINDPDGVFDVQEHRSIYEIAIRIAMDILQESGSSKRLARDGAEDGPWVEDAEGDAVRLVNPGFVFYAASIRGQGNPEPHDVVLLPARERLIGLEWEWPPIQVTESTAVEYPLGSGQYHIDATRGFDTSNGVGELIKWSTANGRATMCNFGKGSLLILDLVIGIGNVSVDFSELHLSIPASVATDLAYSIAQEDAWGMAGIVLDVFLANVDNIAYWVWQEFANESTERVFAAAHGVLKNIAAVMKVFFIAEVGLNQAAPFFYDLVTAPPSVSISVSQEEGVLVSAFANTPPDVPVLGESADNAVVGEEVTFSAVTLDADTDRVQYRFHWGDGSATPWSGLLASGDTIVMSHSFSRPGLFHVLVEARDQLGSSSGASGAHQIQVVPEGHLLFDDFDGDFLNGHPSEPPWVTNSDAPSYVAVTDRVHYGGFGKAVSFIDYDEDVGEDTGGSASIVANLSQGDEGELSFRWRVADASDFFGLRAWGEWDWSKMGYYVLFADGYLEVLNGSNGEFESLQEIEAGRWYEMRLVFDVTSQSYAVHIDGRLARRDIPFVGSPESLEILQVVAFSDRGCRAGYLDDISLSGGVTESSRGAVESTTVINRLQPGRVAVREP